MESFEEIQSKKQLLTDEDKQRLSLQNNRMVSEHKAKLLEIEAKKHWDLFYKRNETRFFRDRHWTTREFEDLLNENSTCTRTLFEVGCGVVACDLSPRAVEMVKRNPQYNSDCMRAFQCDITTEDVFNEVEPQTVDIVTLIFVLSAIHPEKFVVTLRNINKLLKPEGIILFRDYGLYDMAQLRFKPGHKIAENFYMRQDGTRSFYFSTDYVENMFKDAGFNILLNSYIYRRTVNKREKVDVPRIFVQAKAQKQD
ncbi:hypothetical protein NQ314_010928 [Rhamnusium bicolor]|uniref:tRNA N(3)-methylcytidine methyltransferase n=1 Tax=Rhamnusium bicolor TaxID=1586634 RepID=A0AAV8XM66_9CUCU|nr:hypothetical protein NQ314_010928 [Rhamnusium bicolor]